MSLILDALKKSDRNRERGKVPDLQADHSGDSLPKPQLRRHRRWGFPLVVLLLLGSGWLAWQFLPPSDALVATPSPPQPVATPVPPPVEPAPPATPRAAKPLEPAVTAPLPKPQNPVTAVQETPEKTLPVAADPQPVLPAEAEVFALERLPAHIAQGLPELIISVHYFTPKPESRMVRINNRILREGGTLPGGIKIVNIERDGIICETQGVRFRLPTTSLASGRPQED